MQAEKEKLQRVGWIAAAFLMLRAADIAIVLFSGVVSYWLRNGFRPLPQHEVIVIAFVALLSLVVLNLGQAYLTSAAESFWSLTIRVLGHWTLVFLLLLTATFMLKVTEEFSRLWIGGWFVIAALGFITARGIVTSLVRKARREGRLSRQDRDHRSRPMGTAAFPTFTGV